VAHRPLRSEPKTFEVMVCLEEIRSIGNLTKQLLCRAIEHGDRGAACFLKLSQTLFATSFSAIVLCLPVAIVQLFPLALLFGQSYVREQLWLGTVRTLRSV
jgi:hypothetical protein